MNVLEAARTKEIYGLHNNAAAAASMEMPLAALRVHVAQPEARVRCTISTELIDSMNRIPLFENHSNIGETICWSTWMRRSASHSSPDLKAI